MVETLQSVRVETESEFRLILVVNSPVDPLVLPDRVLDLLRDAEYHKCDAIVEILYMDGVAGFSRASNYGLCYSRAEWVCLLSDDVELPHHWDEALMWHCEKRNVAISLPTIRQPGRANSACHFSQDANEVEIACFICVMFPRRTIEKYGLFSMHPALAQLGNDNEYCRRIRKGGGKIVIAGNCCVNAGMRTTIGQLTDAGESARAEAYLKTLE